MKILCKMIFVCLLMMFLVSCNSQKLQDDGTTTSVSQMTNEMTTEELSQTKQETQSISQTDSILENNKIQNNLLFDYEQTDETLIATFSIDGNVCAFGFEAYITYSARDLDFLNVQICKDEKVEIATTEVDGKTYVYFLSEFAGNLAEPFDILTFTFQQTGNKPEIEFSLEDIIIFDFDFNHVEYSVLNTSYVSD